MDRKGGSTNADVIERAMGLVGITIAAVGLILFVIVPTSPQPLVPCAPVPCNYKQLLSDYVELQMRIWGTSASGGSRFEMTMSESMHKDDLEGAVRLIMDRLRWHESIEIKVWGGGGRRSVSAGAAFAVFNFSASDPHNLTLLLKQREPLQPCVFG